VVVAFGVEPPSPRRRLIQAAARAVLTVVVLAMVAPPASAQTPPPRGVEKLWSEYPLSVPARERTTPSRTVTVTDLPAVTRPEPRSGAGTAKDHAPANVGTPVLLFLAVLVGLLALAAAGRGVRSTEGGSRMPDFFRSRGRHAEDAAELDSPVSRTAAYGAASDAAAEDDPQPNTVVRGAPETSATGVHGAGRVGEHVAGIVAAAEAAAATIRADAQSEADELLAVARRTLDQAEVSAAEMRSKVDEYAAARHRDAEAKAEQIVADAERRARSVAGEAADRDRALAANIEASENRLRDLAKSLRTVASSLDDVVGDAEDGKSATDAATGAEEWEEEQPLVRRRVSDVWSQ
jgi:hypothetical protein